MDITYIYYLCKDDGVPLYIGKTKNSPNLRLNDHRYKKEKNLNINVIDEIPTSDWKFWEKHYISLFKSWGFILNNINDGGGGSKGGYFLTEKTKNKIGKANSKPKPLGFGEKLSKIKTGIPLPLGTGDKIGKTKEKSVIQFNREGNIINNFDSAKKAAEYICVHEVNMRLHLGGKYKTCKKFIFKYKCNGN
jgi:hypothetical protein